jgi:hypothetical protein
LEVAHVDQQTVVECFIKAQSIEAVVGIGDQEGYSLQERVSRSVSHRVNIHTWHYRRSECQRNGGNRGSLSRNVLLQLECQFVSGQYFSETYACAIARRIEEVVVEIKRPVVDVRRPGRSTITALNGVVVVNVEAERDVNIVKATQTVVQLKFNAVFVGLRDVELSTREGDIADGGTLDLVETNTTRNICNRG